MVDDIENDFHCGCVLVDIFHKYIDEPTQQQTNIRLVGCLAMITTFSHYYFIAVLELLNLYLASSAFSGELLVRARTNSDEYGAAFTASYSTRKTKYMIITRGAHVECLLNFGIILGD